MPPSAQARARVGLAWSALNAAGLELQRVYGQSDAAWWEAYERFQQAQLDYLAAIQEAEVDLGGESGDSEAAPAPWSTPTATGAEQWPADLPDTPAARLAGGAWHMEHEWRALVRQDVEEALERARQYSDARRSHPSPATDPLPDRADDAAGRWLAFSQAVEQMQEAYWRSDEEWEAAATRADDILQVWRAEADAAQESAQTGAEPAPHEVSPGVTADPTAEQVEPHQPSPDPVDIDPVAPSPEAEEAASLQTPVAPLNREDPSADEPLSPAGSTEPAEHAEQEAGEPAAGAERDPSQLGVSEPPGDEREGEQYSAEEASSLTEEDQPRGTAGADASVEAESHAGANPEPQVEQPAPEDQPEASETPAREDQAEVSETAPAAEVVDDVSESSEPNDITAPSSTASPATAEASSEADSEELLVQDATEPEPQLVPPELVEPEPQLVPPDLVDPKPSGAAAEEAAEAGPLETAPPATAQTEPETEASPTATGPEAAPESQPVVEDLGPEPVGGAPTVEAFGLEDLEFDNEAQEAAEEEQASIQQDHQLEMSGGE